MCSTTHHGGGRAARPAPRRHARDGQLRLEKAYRHFGHDIGDEDHVLEAGLGFAVKTDKPRGRFGDFIGREAVLAQARRRA